MSWKNGYDIQFSLSKFNLGLTESIESIYPKLLDKRQSELDSRFFNALLYSFATAGDFVKTKEIWDVAVKMGKKLYSIHHSGVPRDSYTTFAIIKSLCKGGEAEKALAVARTLPSIDDITFALVAEALALRGKGFWTLCNAFLDKIDLLLEFEKTARQQGLTPSLRSYTQIIGGVAQSKIPNGAIIVSNIFKSVLKYALHQFYKITYYEDLELP